MSALLLGAGADSGRGPTGILDLLFAAGADGGCDPTGVVDLLFAFGGGCRGPTGVVDLLFAFGGGAGNGVTYFMPVGIVGGDDEDDVLASSSVDRCPCVEHRLAQLGMSALLIDFACFNTLDSSFENLTFATPPKTTDTATVFGAATIASITKGSPSEC